MAGLRDAARVCRLQRDGETHQTKDKHAECFLELIQKRKENVMKQSVYSKKKKICPSYSPCFTVNIKAERKDASNTPELLI